MKHRLAITLFTRNISERQEEIGKITKDISILRSIGDHEGAERAAEYLESCRTAISQLEESIKTLEGAE